MATRRTQPDYEQISGYVPKDLALQFRILCTTERRTQSEVLEEAVNLLLDSRDNAKNPPATKA